MFASVNVKNNVKIFFCGDCRVCISLESRVAKMNKVRRGQKREVESKCQKPSREKRNSAFEKKTEQAKRKRIIRLWWSATNSFFGILSKSSLLTHLNQKTIEIVPKLVCYAQSTTNNGLTKAIALRLTVTHIPCMCSYDVFVNVTNVSFKSMYKVVQN